jgi:catechol 2,3-dioxygenase-like lactoylglutathione lyase family enzyme
VLLEPLQVAHAAELADPLGGRLGAEGPGWWPRRTRVTATAKEAAVTMVSWLRSPGVRVLVAHVHPDHHASQAVASGLGLARTGTWHDGEEQWQASEVAREDGAVTHVQRFDHVGVTVADLEAATAFFVGLGLEVEGTGSVHGEFVETVCGIPGAHCEITMLRPPDGGCRLELSSFVTPDHVPGSPAAMANELGLRNVSFEVGDLDAALEAVAADGYGLVSGVGEYENSVRMAYVRGPDGIIVSLFERLG